MKKKIFIYITILAALLCAYGYYIYNKPVSSLSEQKALYSLGANDLLSAYESDESNANTLYLDKIIEVSGQVDKIEHVNGKSSIYLLTDNMMSSIICELETSDTNLSINKGDTVTIKGLCTGYLMDVVLVRSLII